MYVCVHLLCVSVSVGPFPLSTRPLGASGSLCFLGGINGRVSGFPRAGLLGVCSVGVVLCVCVLRPLGLSYLPTHSYIPVCLVLFFPACIRAAQRARRRDGIAVRGGLK